MTPTLDHTIGHLVVTEPGVAEEVQEHAGWYRKITVNPGRYPIVVSNDNRVNDGYVSVRLTGPICANYFGLGRKLNDEVGREHLVWLSWHDDWVAHNAAAELGTVRLFGPYRELSGTKAWRLKGRELFAAAIYPALKATHSLLAPTIDQHYPSPL